MFAMNTLNPPEKKIKFEERAGIPALTICVVLMSLVIYSFTHGKVTADNLSFVANSFQASALYEDYAQHDWSKIVVAWIMGNFMAVALWQLIVSAYFFWLFGVVVEKRLGPGRFAFLVLIGSTLPWIVQMWDATRAPLIQLPGDNPVKFELCFMGPSIVTFALVGAYMILAPPKKVAIGGGMPRPRGEIYRKTPEKPITEKIGLNPWTFIIVYCVWVVGLHVGLSWFYKGFDCAGVLACALSAGIGYTMASMLLRSAIETFKDGPMKLEAIRRYNELIDLDVKSDDAIKGAARAMGLPTDQVRLWVNQNKGRLRVS
jgi:membrane associated rhomboid family serine protease